MKHVMMEVATRVADAYCTVVLIFTLYYSLYQHQIRDVKLHSSTSVFLTKKSHPFFVWKLKLFRGHVPQRRIAIYNAKG